MISLEAPGIFKLGPYGPYKNAVWLFCHEGEAAVVEMPPYNKGRDRQPWRDVGRALKKFDLTLKYALISHAHLDHCQTLMDFRKFFPKTTFVGHRSQAESGLVRRLASSRWSNPAEVFDHVFEGDIQMLHLGREPLYVLHCPKHSQSDQFVIFRGTAMTGDWFLGDLKDCNALVHPGEKIRSVNRVQEWLRRLDYQVSRAFSGHGDCLYHQVDFHRLLEKSKIDHDLVPA